MCQHGELNCTQMRSQMYPIRESPCTQVGVKLYPSWKSKCAQVKSQIVPKLVVKMCQSGELKQHTKVIPMKK